MNLKRCYSYLKLVPVAQLGDKPSTDNISLHAHAAHPPEFWPHIYNP